MKEACARLLVIGVLLLGVGLWLYPSLTPQEDTRVAQLQSTRPTWADTAWAFSKFALSALPGLIVVALSVALISAPFLIFFHHRAKLRIRELESTQLIPRGLERLSYNARARNLALRGDAPMLSSPVPLVAPLPVQQWLPEVAAHREHLLLVGETGSGKTVLAQAIQKLRAETDKVIVIDPHATYNNWLGIPAHGTGRDLDAVVAAVCGIHAEFERRFRERADFSLSIFFDEYPALAALRPEIVPMVKQWAREAAKTGIRLVMLVQDQNVRTLGIQGEGPVRQNFVYLMLGSFAAGEHEVAAQMARPAVRRLFNREPEPIDVTGLPALIQEPLPQEVVWQPTTTSTSMLESDEMREEQRRRREHDEIIKLAAEGLKPCQIKERLYGYSGGIAHRKVRAVLEEAKHSS